MVNLNMMGDTYKNCSPTTKVTYNSSLGFTLAVEEWEAITTVLVLTSIIVVVLVGNILVILSIFTHRPLRTVQNFFLVSLAVADLTVAVFVLPFSVIYQILGRWIFGIDLCKMWLTCDVLCCTASILHLCVIALDRYWAITDPLNYAQKRTQKRVLTIIGGVWVLSGVISSPPVIGWNDWEKRLRNDICELTDEQGYVVYSALGSFYIPLFIMTVVYIEIFIATKKRLRQRARASNLSVNRWNRQQSMPHDQDSASSDTAPNENVHLHEETINTKGKKRTATSKKKRKKDVPLKNECPKKPPLVTEDSVTDNNEDLPGSQCTKNLNHCGEQCRSPTYIRTATTPLGSPITRTASEKECASPTAISGSVSTPSSSTKRYAPMNLFIKVKQRISLSKERRAARTLGIIMGVFVVCWLPFFLMYVIVPFCVACCPSDKLKHFLTWLGYINSGLNPLIYTIFNLDFRRAFKKLLHIK